MVRPIEKIKIVFTSFEAISSALSPLWHQHFPKNRQNKNSLNKKIAKIQNMPISRKRSVQSKNKHFSGFQRRFDTVVPFTWHTYTS